MQAYDIVIVGGGMIGLSLALGLQNAHLSVAVIDTETGDRALSVEPESRVSAINLATQTMLQKLEVWDDIFAERLQPYYDMHVWDQDSFAEIRFSHHQVHQPQLGFIVENQSLRRALWKRAEATSNIDFFAPAKITKLAFGQHESFISLDDGRMLSSRLVVGADGANSMVRQQAALPLTFWDYEQHAIVATVQTEFQHNNTARQIFTPSGPLAFLPLYQPHVCSIVWSQHIDVAEELLSLSDTEFNQALCAAFDGKLGQCTVLGTRQSYPLKMRYCRQWVKDRVALIGDAAHTIHPLAGQGANLGFLDAAALAQTIIDLGAKGLDFGEAKNLRSYERWRKTEATKMIAGMEGFKRLFAGDNPLKKLFRDIGITAVNNMPSVKQNIIQQAMGLSGDLPELAKRL